MLNKDKIDLPQECDTGCMAYNVGLCSVINVITL